MSKTFFSIGMTLDGFIAGPNGGSDNPLGDEGTKINELMFHQQAFLDNLDLIFSAKSITHNQPLTLPVF